MNVLDRIVELRLERGWTEYQLSQQSGITQSTISAWYRKNTLPSIPSLQKICNAFNKPQDWACLPMTNRHIIISLERTELHGKLDT